MGNIFKGLGILVLVGACVPDTPVAREPSDAARVSDVLVRAETVVIRMSDGARCVSARPEGETSGWSGVTEGCGYALPFDVVFRAAGDGAQFLVEDVAGVATAGGARARAEVYVRDVDGVRRQFVQPLGRDVRIQVQG